MLFFSAQRIFARHFGICKDRAAHCDKISLAGGQDLLGTLDVHDRANSAHQEIWKLLFDIRGIMDVIHPVHQIVLPPVAHVLEFAVQTCGNMEDVDLMLNQLDELERLIKVHSVRVNFVGGDTVFDHEIPAA